MIYTLISDIHSNLVALEEFFKSADMIEILVCLGDIVGYGSYPNECTQLIKQKTAFSIKGNHERSLFNRKYKDNSSIYAKIGFEWTEKKITRDSLEYLQKLPNELKLKEKILLVHGSPQDPDEYIVYPSVIKDSFYKMNEGNHNLCFFGHTHVPVCYDSFGNSTYIQDKWINLDSNYPYLINPGSIGQPRDGDKRGSYCLFDEDNYRVMFKRFDYDVESAANHIIESGLPVELAQRLFIGK